MRTGVFGGTFNPPHQGHVQAAAAAVRALGLERIYFIPAGEPPHKRIPAGSATAAQRLEMTALAAALVPGGRALDIELARQGPSYTVDTLARLTELYPGDELWLIVGTDMLISFTRWRQPEKILAMAGLAVVPRAGGDLREIRQYAAALRQSHGARIEIIDTPPVEVSSTEIREGEKLPRLPQAVEEYIRAKGLYGGVFQAEPLRRAARQRLGDKRYIHTLGVEKMAVRLAQIHGEDVPKARQAALLHDIAKEMPVAQQLQLCKKHGIMPQYSGDVQKRVLHADAGAVIAQAEFGMPPDICDAIRYHSTGRAGMSRLEKIIFVADKIEENRRFDDIPPIRAQAMEDLDGAAAQVLRQTLEALKRHGREADPRTGQALEELTARDNPKPG